MSQEEITSVKRGEFQLILFNLGNTLYGIHIEQVSEINRIEEITPLPKAPQFIEGFSPFEIIVRGALQIFANITV